MQFKNPEILYFLFFLIIPIIVHLFQLRRFKKQYFSNVAFLRELSVQTRKSSRIKKWLLLATRLLLLAAAIIAFSQPYFPENDKFAASRELYVILDNSFSMQAKGSKGELLRRAVEDILEHAPQNRQLSVLTNSESYWDTEVKSIQRELQRLDYSAMDFQLESQLATINARNPAAPKDIVIITDGASYRRPRRQ